MYAERFENLLREDKSSERRSAYEVLGLGPVRVLLADDQKLVRDALRPGLLSIANDVQLIECGTLDEAMALVGKHDALSLAILAFHMPGMNGIDGVRRFHDRFPNVPFAILSSSHCPAEIFAVFDCGAAGFVSKSTGAQSIANAIRLMLSGQRYVPDDVLSAAQSQGLACIDTCKAIPISSPLDRLTGRERQVLGFLIKGHSNKVIGRALGVQEVTVKLHIRKLLKRLGVTNRTQAVAFALQAGWEPAPSLARAKPR